MDNVVNIYGSTEMSAPASRGVGTEMVTTRQAQEVQAAMIIAKKFPRNETESYNRIMKACKRATLAEQAMYEYPRGGTKVTGPSIRLAEACAQNWGNIDFGIIELEHRSGESQVMAYAWDLETNMRRTTVFAVPHMRSTKKGNIPLTDPRDIYEMVANQGARRVRACILAVIPGDVIDSAIEQCNLTLKGQNDKPLIDLVRGVTATFDQEFGVTVSMLEKYIGCKNESFTMNDLIRLKKVYKSLQDGMAKREDYFEMQVPDSDSGEISNPFPDKGAKESKKQAAKKPENEEPKQESGELDPSFVPDGQQEELFK
ncbi:MAG: hypothetical protein PHV18_15445 [Lachnospiraceae bacterium]|nr:hypothetical protein [Lachnospiraceae bacterium]